MKIKILKIACPIIEDNITIKDIYKLRIKYNEKRHENDMEKMLDLLNTNTSLS
jgi:hypothetical protein